MTGSVPGNEIELENGEPGSCQYGYENPFHRYVLSAVGAIPQ
jgi:hypothetical protein